MSWLHMTLALLKGLTTASTGAITSLLSVERSTAGSGSVSTVSYELFSFSDN